MPSHRYPLQPRASPLPLLDLSHLRYRLAASPFRLNASWIALAIMYSSVVYVVVSMPVGAPARAPTSRPPPTPRAILEYKPASPWPSAPQSPTAVRDAVRDAMPGWAVDRFAGDSRVFKSITAAGFFVLALTFALLAPAAEAANSLPVTLLALGLKGGPPNRRSNRLRPADSIWSSQAFLPGLC